MKARIEATAVEKWNAFWYESSSAAGLAACRVCFFAALLMYYLRVDFKELAGVPAIIWQRAWPIRLVGIGVPSAAALEALQWLWRIALLAACIGLAWPWSTAAAFGLGFYLIGLTENVAKINHSDAIVVFSLAAMALSRCADAFSVDALLGRAHANRYDESGEYTWPLRFMWLVFATIYFTAGVTKLVTSGPAWVTSDNLSNLLVFGPLTESPLTALGQEIGRHRALSSILAGLAVALELSMPLVLVSRVARRLLVPSIFVMQLCIRALLGPGFTEFFICGLFWIPWDAVVRHFRRDRPTRWGFAANGLSSNQAYRRFSSPRVRTLPNPDPLVHE